MDSQEAQIHYSNNSMQIAKEIEDETLKRVKEKRSDLTSEEKEKVREEILKRNQTQFEIKN